MCCSKTIPRKRSLLITQVGSAVENFVIRRCVLAAFVGLQAGVRGWRPDWSSLARFEGLFHRNRACRLEIAVGPCLHHHQVCLLASLACRSAQSWFVARLILARATWLKKAANGDYAKLGKHQLSPEAREVYTLGWKSVATVKRVPRACSECVRVLCAPSPVCSTLHRPRMANSNLCWTPVWPGARRKLVTFCSFVWHDSGLLCT